MGLPARRARVGALRPGIRRAIDERLLRDPDLDDERENELRRAALTTLRGYDRREGLFHGFPDDVRWERAALTPDEVLVVQYIEYDYWVELSGGTRRPGDAANRIRAGVTIFGVANDGFLELADELATTKVSELIVVGGRQRSARGARRTRAADCVRAPTGGIAAGARGAARPLAADRFVGVLVSQPSRRRAAVPAA